jgi:glyoxylase-like metal-dependent hydrolase (beta-lactamase superfamily II)
MTVGPYRLHEVLAGQLRLDGGAMFGIIPRPLWEGRIPPDDRGRIPLAMRCLLLESSDRLILIDSGLGDKYDDKFADIYGVDQESSNLLASLQQAGFAREDVTDVILTHLHFDHCGGSTRRGASGELEVTFPNARHHVQRAHWDWAHESPREQASFLTENLAPLAEAGVLHFVDGEQELFDGVSLHVVNGHTRGQQLVRIHDGRQQVLFAADLLPTAAHVPLLWVMAYDVAPLDTIREKEVLLEQAAAEGWLVVFEHDVRHAAGRIEKTERGYRAIDLRQTLE